MKINNTAIVPYIVLLREFLELGVSTSCCISFSFLSFFHHKYIKEKFSAQQWEI